MLLVVGMVCYGFVEDSTAVAQKRLSVLIVDGRNNHNWQITSDALRATLEASGRFTVTVSSAPESTSPRALRAPKSDKVAVLAAFEENASFFEFFHFLGCVTGACLCFGSFETS